MTDQQSTKEGAHGQLVDFEALDLRQYAFILLKRKWFILLFAVLATAITALWTMGQQRVFSAACSIVIDAQAPQVLGEIRDAVNIGSGGYWYNREYYETQYRIIRSREVADRVVQRLSLAGDQGFLGIDALPPEAREDALAKTDPAAVLLGRLSVEPVKDSMVVMIRFEDRDPERAAAVANAVAETYMQLNVERRAEGSRDAADWLDDQRRDLKQRHEKSELALYEFKRDNGLVYTSLEDKQTMTSQKFATIGDSLTKARLRRAELSSKVRKIGEARKSGDLEGILALEDVASSPFVVDLKKRRLEAQDEVLDLSERYGDEHPKMKVAREKLQSATSDLKREAELILAARVNEYAELLETEKSLAGMLDEVKQEAFDNSKKEIDYKRLAREEANNRGLFDLVIKRMTELDLSSLLKSNNVRMLEQASVPVKPIRPRPVRNLAVALIVGLVLGMGIALLLDTLDQSVRGPEELSAMGLDCLGLLSRIPAGKNNERDRFVADAPQSVLSEQMRAIRTNMLFMRPDSPPRSIVVTSSFPQEGKTTTLVNLGITLAQAGAKVLLVDSDMRRPRLHKSFGMDDCDKGLSSAIAGTCPLDDAVRATDIENLSILPCGPIPPNPAELLHTRRFQDLVREMAGKYDRVLFDSPPAGIVTDAIILSNELDGTIFVVKAMKTERQAVESALGTLREAGAKMLGAILNNMTSSRMGGYYGGHYGGYYGGYYRYGSYGQKSEGKKRRRHGSSSTGRGPGTVPEDPGTGAQPPREEPPTDRGKET